MSVCKIGHLSKDCRSKETSAFEADDELAETGCIEMASIDLNALDIGTVQLPEADHRVRIGIDLCAAVTVFPKSVADDYPMLHTPGVGQASAGFGCAKGASQAPRWVSQVRKSENCGHAQSFDGSVRN